MSRGGGLGTLGYFERGLVVALAVGMTSGCAWGPRSRPVRPGAQLELPSVVTTAPGERGWRAARELDDPDRQLQIFTGSELDQTPRWLSLFESRGDLPSEEALREWLASVARFKLGVSDPRFDELRVPLPERFGPSAVAVVARLEEREERTKLLRRRAVCAGTAALLPPGGQGRVLLVSRVERGWSDELGPEVCERLWSATLEGIRLRPPTPENVRTAARAGDFPKSMAERLARRSLTLPRGAVQLEWGRRRWVAPGGFSGSMGLAAGLADRLELSAPGFLRVSFGEFEALTRPEYALGVGLTGFEHDSVRGSAWTFGASAGARRRIAPDVALAGALLAEATHESRTDRTRPAVTAKAGVVWDALEWASLGLEAGACSSRWDGRGGHLVWVGGLSTPLVTFVLPPLDVGFEGAAAWDSEGRAGARVGVRLTITL